MEIPILNLYYLLCYAWNRLDEADVVEVSSEDATSLLNLFGTVLLSGTRHLIRRGMDRGYIQYREALRGIRGKIDFAGTVKKQLHMNAMLQCEFDELSHNVLHNQILKTTISRLTMSPDVDREIRDGLAGLDRRLRAIDKMPLSASIFSRVQLHRNNAFYGFLMDVCEMVYLYYLASETEGDSRFRDFVRDPARMPQVFENFVRNFYRIELEGKHSGYRVVGAEYIDWDVDETESADRRFLPKMLTDVSLQTPYGYLIIDTKYYKEALSGRYDDRVRSDNLYQMFAYVKNVARRGPEYNGCCGTLLYPAVQNDIDLAYEIQGHRIRIRTVDLDKPWQEIHNDLLEIVEVQKAA